MKSALLIFRFLPKVTTVGVDNIETIIARQYPDNKYDITPKFSITQHPIQTQIYLSCFLVVIVTHNRNNDCLMPMIVKRVLIVYCCDVYIWNLIYPAYHCGQLRITN
ncbi:Hypothetical_protein [Hexamita inflata]|uniref:Hypothetical_protein n=1 Tax=Hexamita inflata TaxID=28002 RepID=A0ABP1GLA4_9EUKA